MKVQAEQLMSGSTWGVATLSLTLILLILIHANPSLGADYERPVSLKAEKILPAELVKSKWHKVESEVLNDGLFNTYRVQSPLGKFTVRTTLRLKQLAYELQVIAKMREVETGDVVVSSLEQSGKNVVKGVGSLFTDPQGSFEGAVSGAQSLFGRAKETIGRRKISKAEDSRVEQIIGISKSKGEIATQYGVSVYSENKLLQTELDRLGRADFAGGLGVGVVQATIPGMGGALLTVSGSTRLLNEVINTTAASELWVRNKKTLLDLKYSEGLVEYFLNNPSYSPAQKTIITEALKRLKGTERSQLLLETGLQVSSMRMANVVTVFITMIAAYNEKEVPVASLKPVGRFAYGINSKGKKVLFLPTDHVIWSERLENVVNDIENGGAPGDASVAGEVLSLGTLSKKAVAELDRRGWIVKTNVGIQNLRY